MTHSASLALQAAVLAALRASAPLRAKVAGIYDEPPPGTVMPHIMLGDTREEVADTKSDAGRYINFDITVTARDLGQQKAKELMALVDETLHRADLMVDGFKLIGLRLQTSRVSTPGRRLNDTLFITTGRMTFRALLYKSS